MKFSFAVVVVLYNPDSTIIDNIKTYINNVDIIYIVDNSDQKKTSIVEKLLKNSKIHYIDNKGNQGIAHALNTGAYKAIEMGYKWLLTMDQDSSFLSEIIESYFTCFEKYVDKQNIAIFSPKHIPLETHSEDNTCDVIQKTHVMTSGNLLNLTIFEELAGFNEKLFIDEVDHEYCLRAKLEGYSVLEFSNIFLNHNLGEPISIQRYGRTIKSSTHSPIRFYYITRNRLYMWKTYHRLFPNLLGIKLINIVKTIIFPLIYHDKKAQRFYYIIRGILHFLIGRYGK